MTRLRILAGVLVLVAGVACAQDDPLSVKDGKTKLQMCSGLPCIEVMVDKRKLMMAIDTGNPHSVVDTDLATLEGLDVAPYVGRDGKTVPGWGSTAIPSVKSGTLEFKNLPVTVGHLGDTKSANQMPEVDGTLGYDAFTGKSLRIDYKKATLEVSSAAGGCEGAGSTMKILPFGKNGKPVATVTGFTVGGKPVVAQVDTLFAGTMVIYSVSVDPLGLTAATKTKTLEHFPYTGGGVDMKKGSAPVEFSGRALGSDVYFAPATQRAPDGNFEATVGMGVFNGKTVTFDFAHSCFGMM